MKIIFVDGRVDEKHGASTSVVLKGWMRLGLSLCLLGLPVLLGYYGFQLAESRSNELRNDAAAQAWAAGLREQKADLERVKQQTLTQLQALTLRMASLQARLIGLDLLGERAGSRKLAQLRPGKHVETAYGRDPKLLVKVGDVVKRGQVIALSAFTGRFTSSHVHFEVHKHGRVVDPASYIHTTSR